MWTLWPKIEDKAAMQIKDDHTLGLQMLIASCLHNSTLFDSWETLKAESEIQHEKTEFKLWNCIMLFSNEEKMF